MKQPCPACPDGNEWGANGPTGRACKTCGGNAYVEPVDAYGPAGTTGCACVSTDARMCSAIRCGEEDRGDESCECLCHTWEDDE